MITGKKIEIVKVFITKKGYKSDEKEYKSQENNYHHITGKQIHRKVYIRRRKNLETRTGKQFGKYFITDTVKVNYLQTYNSHVTFSPILN